MAACTSKYHSPPRALAVVLAALWFGAGCTGKDDAPVLETGSKPVVKEVVKGDELVVEIAGNQVGVRLMGIHAFDTVVDDPVLAEFSDRVTARMVELLTGKASEVTLGDPPKDSHGRYLLYLQVEGKDIAESLLREGLAVVYTEYAFGREKRFLQAEALARTGKIGLWNAPRLPEIVRGLRRQWSEFRAESKRSPVFDPLLNEPAPSVPAAPGGK